jgi:hypothetical protein
LDMTRDDSKRMWPQREWWLPIRETVSGASWGFEGGKV